MHDIEWIERYLDRSLTASERLEMEHRLESDPELRSKYESHHELIKGIRLSHLHQKLEQLRTLEKSLPAVENSIHETKQVRLFTYWKPLALAATLLIIASAVILFYDPTPVNEKLFTAYYEPFDSPGPGLTRSQNTGKLTWKEKGYLAYDNNKYQQRRPHPAARARARPSR